MLIPLNDLKVKYRGNGYFYEVKEDGKVLFHTDFNALFLASKVGYSIGNYNQLSIKASSILNKAHVLSKCKEFFAQAEEYTLPLLDGKKEFYSEKLYIADYSSRNVNLEGNSTTGKLHLFYTKDGFERWVNTQYIISPKVKLYTKEQSALSDGIAMRYENTLVGFFLPCKGNFEGAIETDPIIEDIYTISKAVETTEPIETVTAVKLI